MPLQITGRHISVSQDQKDYIEKKVGRLRSHFDHIDVMSFVLEVQKLTNHVEIEFRSGKIHVFAKDAEPDMFKAIDKAMHKLEAQINKTWGKKFGGKLHAPRISESLVEEDDDLDDTADEPDDAEEA